MKNIRLFAILSAFTIINAGLFAYNVRATEAADAAGVEMYMSSDAPEMIADAPKGVMGLLEDHLKSQNPETDEIEVSSSQYVITENDIRRIIREEITADPKFVIDALNDFSRQQQENEAREADQKLLSLASEITKSEGYPSVGNPNGSIEVFYYFDVNCGFCRRIHPQLNRFVAANKDVKLVHREMPILAESSRTAASVGGTLYHLYPDAYEEFHEALFKSNGSVTSEYIEKALIDAIGEDATREVISASFNVSDDEIARDTANRIKATLDTATEAGITGTPFLFVKDANLFLRGAVPSLYDQLTSAAEALRNK